MRHPHRPPLSDAFADDEEEIRRVLRDAGPRPEASADDLVEVRTAARQEWLAMTQRVRARRRRRLAIALAAALAAAVGLLRWRAPEPTPPVRSAVAAVELLRGGSTTNLPGEARRPLEVGEELLAGTIVETAAGTPADGLALQILSRGISLRLAAGSRVALAGLDQVELFEGALYVDALPGRQGGALTVVTESARVEHVGTQFEVALIGDRATPDLRLRVREGEVRLHAADRNVAVERGEELVLDADGAVERRAIPTHGELWAWVEATAPAMAIEGAQLLEVLGWVSRETGRRLEWSADDLEGRAATIRLHGSIAGLSPVQALDIVLTGSRLRHRLDGDAVVIDAAED